MSEKKIIAVFGATGAQGGGMARAILADPDGEFAVRAITRNPQSEKAQELAKAGAEVVAANLDDRESIVKVLQGAYGAFVVTNYWEYISVEREKGQIANAASAAKAAGLKHVVWSTLPDSRNEIPVDNDRMPTLEGKYNVPHFDGKGEGNAYFTEAGVPTTFLNTTFYWEDFCTFFPLTRTDDGKRAITVPMGERKLSGIAAEDIGGVALAIFKRGEEFIGKSLNIGGENLTGEQYAAQLSKTLGEDVVYRPMTFDAFRALGFPGADDLGNMFQYYYETEENFAGSRDPESLRKVFPALQDFATWAEKHKDRFSA
ncbi:NmrA/HSCARG family protein [Micromonospora sp. NPDC005367]|uniref:NmrA/HSCARG family protein n=1 Tax=Micromonospora sp. NPDC005367 TaxID=3155590 RepID=UPI0033A8AF1C